MMGTVRRYQNQHRYKRKLREAQEDRQARMTWLQLAANVHHSQHLGETRSDCGICRPDHLVEILDKLSPLPKNPSKR